MAQCVKIIRKEQKTMATNQKPSMLHRVVGNDASGVQRSIPCASQWKAEAEAKAVLKRGWQDVEVQTWDSDTKQFAFNVTANNHLIAQDKRVEVNEDALEALARLGASQKAIYKAASSGKATQDEIDSFVSDVQNVLRHLGVNMLEPVEVK